MNLQQGPSPESLYIGEVDGKTVIFIGIERPGMVAVYSLEEGSITPNFESLHYYGNYEAARNKTYGKMYTDRETHSNDPEDIK